MADFLAMPPSDREATHIDLISEYLHRQAEAFVASIYTDQLQDICRRALHRVYPKGADICNADDDLEYYFVVLSGLVYIEEPAVHHQDAATAMRHASERPAVGAYPTAWLSICFKKKHV